MKYIICAENRTRSTLLCELLENTEFVGDPFQSWPLKDGVGGCKVTWGDFCEFKEEVDISSVKFIWLGRYNKIRQAISFLKARKRDSFCSADDNDLLSDGVVLRLGEVLKIIGWISVQDSMWHEFFRTNNINPLILWYSDLDTEDLQINTLNRVLEFLEVTERVDQVDVFIKPQSSQWDIDVYNNFCDKYTNEEW